MKENYSTPASEIYLPYSLPGEIPGLSTPEQDLWSNQGDNNG